MNLKICYFGLLADRRGLSEEWRITHAQTAAELYAELDSIYQLGLSMADFRVAVNDEFAAWEDTISENDTIAFLPPMSGG